MVKKGYEVDVLTSIPNYPEGIFYKGYGIFSKRVQRIDSVKIYRALQTPRGKNASAIGLSFNYLTYAFFASIWAFFFALFKRKYHSVIVHQTSPITQAYPGIVVSKVQKVPLYMWVLDIWPDAMVSGGGVKNKTILSFMNNRVKNIYHKCDKILISSKKMSESILSKGDFKDKIIYFPNWAESIFENPDYKETPQLPGGYKIMFAGNLGGAQDLESVMKAALILKDTEVKWVFIGDGSKKAWIEEFVEKNSLQNNVFLLGRYPIELMPSFYKQADALLLTLRSKFPHLKMIVPAKLQTYMTSGKPVIGMIDGGAADLIKEADCGLSVNAGDYKSLAKLIMSKILTDKSGFASKGENGKKFFKENFTLDGCINNLIKIIEDGKE